MPNIQDTLYRHWHMLRLVPRDPKAITVNEIKDALERQGFTVTTRTLQRDLQELSKIFPLAVDEQEKPFGWSWQKDAPSYDLPSLTTPEALAWAMAEQHLEGLLPVSIMEYLQPQFKAAYHQLDAEGTALNGRVWQDKLRTEISTSLILTPQIAENVYPKISDALLREKQVEVRYRKSDNEENSSHRIHPLGLVQRGPVIYLYCRLFDNEESLLLPLHQIEEVNVFADDAIYPDDFNLDR